MCAVLLPPGVNPIAVIYIYIYISHYAVSDGKQLIYQPKIRTTPEDLNLKQHRCQTSGLKPLIFLAVTRIPTIHSAIKSTKSAFKHPNVFTHR
jgi:hypothetical protein